MSNRRKTRPNHRHTTAAPKPPVNGGFPSFFVPLTKGSLVDELDKLAAKHGVNDLIRELFTVLGHENHEFCVFTKADGSRVPMRVSQLRPAIMAWGHLRGVDLTGEQLTIDEIRAHYTAHLLAAEGNCKGNPTQMQGMIDELREMLAGDDLELVQFEVPQEDGLFVQVQLGHIRDLAEQCFHKLSTIALLANAPVIA